MYVVKNGGLTTSLIYLLRSNSLRIQPMVSNLTVLSGSAEVPFRTTQEDGMELTAYILSP